MERRNIAVCLIVISSIAIPVQADILYDLIDLGQGIAYDINNDGQVAGVSFDTNRATLFDTSGKGDHFIWNTSSSSCAYSINDNGLIVGSAGLGAIFNMDGGYSTPGGNVLMDGAYQKTVSGSKINSINDSGRMVGTANNYATIFKAEYNYNRNTAVWHHTSYINSINEHGDVAGFYNTQGRVEYNCPDGSVRELGTLGGYMSEALSINDNRQIVGWAETNMNNRERHATLFTRNGNVDLDPVGDDLSRAHCINNAGIIVGAIREPGTTWAMDAVIFDITGQGNNINLNDAIDPSLGWNLMEAYAVNEDGWIVGKGLDPDGYTNAFLLKPVPEPASIMIIGLGAILLRKQRK